MALTITSAEKDLVARTVFNQEYSSTSSAEQDQIDKASIQALNRIGQYAAVFTGTGQTVGAGTNIPAQWLHWWQVETEAIVARSYRPSLLGGLDAARDSAIEAAFSGFTTTDADATNVGSSAITPNDIRKYILATCVRQQPRRVWVDVSTVDAAIQEAFDRIWNYRTWSFRTRPVTVRMSGVAFTGATWTESSLTLTDTGAFASYSFQAGDLVRITGGTSIVRGDYRVASSTDDTLVLDSSCSATGGDLSGGDIAGTVMVARVYGLASGESFKRLAGRELRTGSNTTIVWATTDALDSHIAEGSTLNEAVRAFRYDKGPDGTVYWRFFPLPSSAIEARGFAELEGPAVLGDASTTTLLNQLPRRFRLLARDLALAIVMAMHMRGADDPEAMLEKRIRDLIEDDDKGVIDDQQSALDLYNDHSHYLMSGESL